MVAQRFSAVIPGAQRRCQYALAHPIAGSSWEGHVIEQLIAAAPDAQASFYRTSNGAEADLVLTPRSGQACWRRSKHLRCAEQLNRLSALP